MQLVLKTFERVRRVPRRLRLSALRYVAIAVAVGAAAIAAPVLAHDGSKPPAPACGSTLPLTTPCTPTVVAPTTAGGAYTVTLAGVGTLNFKLDPATNTITSASLSGLSVNFTASTPKIDGDADKVTVTFTSTTDPTQVYRVTVKVKDPATAGGAPVIKAKVRGAAAWHSHKHHGEQGEQGERRGHD
jgi:hypothetical protein